MGHVTTEEAAEMIQLAAEGRTQREIAELTKRALPTVNKTIQSATEQIAEYKAAEYRQIIGTYHESLKAIAERARDEFLGAPAGKADPRNAAAAIAAIREDANLLRLPDFVAKAQLAAAEPPSPRIIKIRKSFRKADNPERSEEGESKKKRRLISKHKQERSKRKRRNEGLDTKTTIPFTTIGILVVFG